MEVILIIVGAVTRLVPHPYNFTAVGALAIFVGANLKKSQWYIPFIVMLFTDTILGFHSTMIYVYASFALGIGIGYLIRKKQNILTVPMASLISSILFYLITNFGVWQSSVFMYEHTLNGLMLCYIVAIPFFRNTVLGDLVYTTAFFSAYHYRAEIWNQSLLLLKLSHRRA